MTKLNLACGDDRREGFVNMDLRADVADVVGDVTLLPYIADYVEEILALDILEHFPQDRIDAILREWKRVLKPGGKLTVRVPNIYRLSEFIVRAYEGGNDGTVTLLVRNVMGGHRWGPDGAWDAHHWSFTPRSLTDHLHQVGMTVVAVHDGINMTVEAIK